jgi:hypothetical protein
MLHTPCVSVAQSELVFRLLVADAANAERARGFAVLAVPAARQRLHLLEGGHQLLLFVVLLK